MVRYPLTSTKLNSSVEGKTEKRACIFNIQRYSVQDGPGIRTTVFFKGCPLACLWCDNPESQALYPQLFYFDSLCIRCYRCVEVCPNKAISVGSDGSVETDRKLCKACGVCAAVCAQEARAISGKLMTVDEVLEVVKKDALFYRNSGGGVTASGGEASHQADFLSELFRRCQEECGFHTCLDTCGYTQWKLMKEILPYVDLVLYDLKHMDSKRHKELTGVGNELILENCRRIVEQGIPLIIRVPLIPGCNDSEENLRAMAEYVRGLGLSRLDLLPYHQLGGSKYQRLGMKYKLAGLNMFKKEEVEAKQTLLESYGLKVEII